MNQKDRLVKTLALLVAPLLAFAVLLVPYSWANHRFFVEWFGCGCPKVDELGNIVHPDFNANDFTALFWLFVTVCVTIASAFLSRRIPKEKTWLRVLYVAGMFLVSLGITYLFYGLMMWN